MTYLGTRPPTVDEYEQYELGHRKRLAMKPGLTGMWQVSGRSDITDFDEVVALDAKYIEQWDIALDIKILWKVLRSNDTWYVMTYKEDVVTVKENFEEMLKTESRFI